MSWIEKIIKKSIKYTKKKSKIPSGIWTKCDNCNQFLYTKELEKNLKVCPKCDFHMKIQARKRLKSFLDIGSESELCNKLEPKDILKFKDIKKYKDRIYNAQKNTKEKEAIIVMKGELYTIPIIAVSFEFSFIGGSLSSVVGAKFVYAVKQSIKNKCPLICFSTSGGARIQEGLISLMQMAKTTAALAKLKKNKLPYISVLTNPTMGGVSASLGMLGDINVAEPKALIGFAGPRIIEQTVKEKLPKNFQRSEFLLEKGVIDIIIRRHDMRKCLASIIEKLTYKFI